MFAIAILGVAITILLETGQQLAFKHASKAAGLKPWWMLLGAGMYAPQQLCWMFTLTLLPLAIAAPLLGASYVTVPLASGLVFREKISKKRWLGILLIVCGIALISREIST
jgi:undecaprenyl phosphate-alpha-L-ara4N flippase subunit ArnE